MTENYEEFKGVSTNRLKVRDSAELPADTVSGTLSVSAVNDVSGRSTGSSNWYLADADTPVFVTLYKSENTAGNTAIATIDIADDENGTNSERLMDFRTKSDGTFITAGGMVLVPPGKYYRVTGTGTLYEWFEQPLTFG